jgi:GTP-binding protein
MQIAVLVEQMRREGFEVLVSRPVVIFRRDDNGKLFEPFETLYVEAPGDYTQGILKILMNRKGMMEHMDTEPSGRDLHPSRHPDAWFDRLRDGTGQPHLRSRHHEPLVQGIRPSTPEKSRTAPPARSFRWTPAPPLPTRCKCSKIAAFFSSLPGDAVYGGMLVGENPRVGDLPVNPVKEKHLDNMRSSGKDKTSKLTPPVRFSLERAIEYIDADELVEATPQNIRLRKRILDANARKRSQKTASGAEDRGNR